MSNQIELPHTCPECGKTKATTESEARNKFGFRTMTNKDGSKYIRIQSWCKKCR